MRLSNWKVYSSTLELPNYASVLHYLLGLALKQPSWFWPQPPHTAFCKIPQCVTAKNHRNEPCSPNSVHQFVLCSLASSVPWHCWLGDRNGIRPVKKLDVGLLVVIIWLELCTTHSSSSSVVTTTSIILCFNKHQLTHVYLENDH